MKRTCMCAAEQPGVAARELLEGSLNSLAGTPVRLTSLNTGKLASVALGSKQGHSRA
jgi:hypothetical protein